MEGSMSRIEKTFRCSKDGRAVARIEISEQKRWLVRVAGRDGHVTSLSTDLEEAAEGWREGRKSIAEERGADWYFKVLGRLLQPDANYTEQREELPAELDVMNHELGYPPIPKHGVCPKCHTPYKFLVEVNHTGPSGVLMSHV